MTSTETERPAVIGYARLSKNPDGTIESVADQTAVMRRYADAHGLRLVLVYDDDNRSAWRTDRPRKGWEKFLTALAVTDGIAGALSYHFDRLARNGRDGERFLGVMELRNLALWTPQQVQNLGADADARMVFRIMVAVAINQSDSTSRRVRMHKDERRLAGNLRYVLGGNPPLGLTDGAEDWATDPANGPRLADVAARVLRDPEHLLPGAVEASARAVGVLTDASGACPTIKAIRAALRRPASAGLMTDRAGEVIAYEPVIANPPLDVATFRALRAMFAGRRRGPAAGGDDGVYIYGPILRCDSCGNQLSGCPIYDRRPTGETGADGRKVYAVHKVTASYSCKNAHKRLGVTRPCRRVSVPAEDANEVIRRAVDAWRSVNPDYADAAGRRAGTGSRETALNARLDRAQADMSDLFANRRYMSAGRFAEARADLAGEIDAILDDLETVAEVAATPLPAVTDWAEMTPAEARALAAEALVTPIRVRPGNGGTRALTALDRMAVVPR